MKTVACFIDKYLQLSETFIYNEIKHIEKFPTVIITKSILNRDIFPFDSVFTYNKKDITRILLENNVGLIHAHFGWSGISAIPIAVKYSLPLIVTFYGIDASRMMHYFFYRRNIKRLFRTSQLILTMSKDMKQDLIKEGCVKEKLKVHYIGINSTQFRIKKQGSGDILRILMCGRFVEKKGFEYGVRAFKQMKNKSARLVIIGDGKLRPYIKEVIESLGISSNVNLTGFLKPEDVREAMSKSDIFLAPHITGRNGDKEGMPTTIKEAMAAGLPVISTYHAGIPEIVKHGKSGFLVNECDIEGLTNFLNKLAEDQNLREEMGINGRKIIEERFTLKREIREIEEVYEKYIK
ncbi:glycosyltransferase [candidate division WOR-3 bacterium]|nr:glycosyltransferase [candidate division WOR-3 bacterium]